MVTINPLLMVAIGFTGQEIRSVMVVELVAMEVVW